MSSFYLQNPLGYFANILEIYLSALLIYRIRHIHSKSG